MAGPVEAAKASKPASAGWTDVAFAVLAVVAAVIVLRLPELSSGWKQQYDPTGHWLLSTLIASLPVVVLSALSRSAIPKRIMQRLPDWRQHC